MTRCMPRDAKDTPEGVTTAEMERIRERIWGLLHEKTGNLLRGDTPSPAARVSSTGLDNPQPGQHARHIRDCDIIARGWGVIVRSHISHFSRDHTFRFSWMHRTM